jgi:hypothetical protein
LANAKGDEFLQNVIGSNITSLEAVKHMPCSASSSSNYCTHHHIVDAYADEAQVYAELIGEEVVTLKAGRGSCAEECVSYSPDLWYQRLEKVSNGAPLGAYKWIATGCCICNNSSFHLKHPGVPDGSDASDRTSRPLTGNHT